MVNVPGSACLLAFSLVGNPAFMAFRVGHD